MRDPEKEYENAQDVQMEMKARNEEMTNEEAIKFLSQIMDAILVSNSWLPSTDNPIKESFGMAINALTAQPEPSQVARDIATIIENEKDMRVIAQPETHEERTETHECDYISRQAAIDAILAVTGNSSVRELYEHVQEHGLSDMWSGGVNAAIDIIIAVPSAQPDSKELSGTHKALDTVSRQAVIDALTSHIMPHNNEDGTVTIGVLSKSSIKNILNKLPSAQPDMSEYSDKLWKKAYERGKAEAQAEIIRCKDCKYWNDEFAKDKSTCWLPCMSMTTHREWHCGSAERRTDA